MSEAIMKTTAFYLTRQFLLLVLIGWFVNATFPPPQHGNLRFCDSIACWVENIAMYRSYDPVVIGLLTHSFLEDSYLSLYLGSIMHQFTMPTMLSLVIVLQRPVGMSMYDAGVTMLQTLPQKSVFVMVQHGMERFSVADFSRALDLNITPPSVLYHMNHEEPWHIADSIGDSFNSLQEWNRFYRRFPLVLRNYYYAPMQQSSYYLPLHPPFQGFILANESSPINELIGIKASQRPMKCFFRGRVGYSFLRVRDDADGSINDMKVQQDIPSAQEIERQEMFQLAKANKLGGCVLENHEPSDDDLSHYDEIYSQYMINMANTVFVPSPTGNNPETFRHYEALEVGAIPIIIRTNETTKNFFNYDLWSSYPGPVLNHWSELDELLSNLTPREMDVMQSRVNRWYLNFRDERSSRLGQRLRQVFQSIQSRTSLHKETCRIEEPEEIESDEGNLHEIILKLRQDVRMMKEQLQQQDVRLRSINMEMEGSRNRENNLLSELRFIIQALFSASLKPDAD